MTFCEQRQLIFISAAFLVTDIKQDISHVIMSYMNTMQSQNHKRLPGKDIFDALEKYRKKYILNRIVLISFGLLLVLLLVIMKFAESRIALWIALIVWVGIIVIAYFIGGKKDFEFKSMLEMKRIAAEKNIDILRLNMDFMMATNHILFDGIAVLGMDYLVIYAKDYCDIVNIKDIIDAEYFCDVQKTNDVTIKRYKVRTHMSYKFMITMTMKNEAEMKLMANELGIRGLKIAEKTL